MRRKTFWAFVSPSVLAMLLLMFIPLCITFYLSVQNEYPLMEKVVQENRGPFGVTKTVTQCAVKDDDGNPIMISEFIGFEYFGKVLGIDELKKAVADRDISEIRDIDFWSALEFTLLYILCTTPCTILIGFGLAMGVNKLTSKMRTPLITIYLLPHIITPVVGALTIKWLFRENGLVQYLLTELGMEIYWMANMWSARLLVILYGIWFVTPFAFIVLYAGLQSVPGDVLEAATVDGANRRQRLRHVVIPHLMPLFSFIALIQMMDAYRVFEPVLVLTKGTFAKSLQFLTYFILIDEDNVHKAAAAAVLTIIGILILLTPVLRRTYREHREARA